MSIVGDLISDKSMEFSIRIVKLYKWLCSEKNEYVLSKQLLRSGTSIGANIAEAQVAISKADFISKLYISFKECLETLYWLELLCRTDYLDKTAYESIKKDAKEIERLLSSITKTAKDNS